MSATIPPSNNPDIEMVVNAITDGARAALALPAPPTEGAWRHFTGRATADPVTCLVADWRPRADIYLRLATVSDGTFDAHWGATPDNPIEIHRGTVVLRAPGRTRRFATVLELHRGTPTVQAVSLDADTVTVRLWGEEEARGYGNSGCVRPGEDQD